MTIHIALLRATLADTEATLDRAEKERDDWEPDSDNPGHTADYDIMVDECYTLPDPLGHLRVSDLMREHTNSAYHCGFSDWEDAIRGERERRRTWSDFDELCDTAEEAESARDDAQEAVDSAEEAISTHPTTPDTKE